MHGRYWNMPFGMWGGWIIPIILIVVIAIAVYIIVNNNKGKNKEGSNPALEILNERFAKGEIDEEEYNRRKTILKD